jgi:hypothetical protein
MCQISAVVRDHTRLSQLRLMSSLQIDHVWGLSATCSASFTAGLFSQVVPPSESMQGTCILVPTRPPTARATACQNNKQRDASCRGRVCQLFVS